MDGILAWHFCREDRRLGYGDEREIRVGETLSVEGPLELCKHGLHASVQPLDALTFSPGPIICRVEVGGDIEHGYGKLVGTERTTIGMADATDVLHEFACWCAELALDATNINDEPYAALIEVKRRWVRGEITDGELNLEAARRVCHVGHTREYGARASVKAAANVAATWAAKNAFMFSAQVVERAVQSERLTADLERLFEGAMP